MLRVKAVPGVDVVRNAHAKLERIPETRVAAELLSHSFNLRVRSAPSTRWLEFLHHTRAHLLLVMFSLSAAIAVAVPLGITATRHLWQGRLILAFAGIIQTIPSLVLLVFMIPLLGIGGPPAVLCTLCFPSFAIPTSSYVTYS